MRIFLVAATGVAAVLAACSSGDAAGPSNGAGTGTASGPITFHKHVEPILRKVCQNCHVAGGIAPFTLVSFADAKRVASSIVQQTATHAMPPWGAQDTAECTPPKPVPRLRCADCGEYVYEVEDGRGGTAGFGVSERPGCCCCCNGVLGRVASGTSGFVLELLVACDESALTGGAIVVVDGEPPDDG